MKKLFVVVFLILILISLSGCESSYAPKVIPKEYYDELLEIKENYCSSVIQSDLDAYDVFIDNLMLSYSTMELYPYNNGDLSEDKFELMFNITKDIKYAYKQDIEHLKCKN